MIPGREAWQAMADCPHCRVESAVLQWMDPTHPACHLGVPADARCRMCGWQVVAEEEPFAANPAVSGRCPACAQALSPEARGGEAPCGGCGYAPRTREVAAPADLTDPSRAEEALDRWAAEEGVDAEAFCAANLGATRFQTVARLVAKEPVGTTFDVVAWLFPSHASGRAPGVADARVVARDPAIAPLPAEPPAAPIADPRAPGRVLASVMLADGDLNRSEQRYIADWLVRHALPALEDSDLRVWRAHEIGHVPKELREALVEACAELAHLDRERDGSEWKVIHAFSRAWGIPDDRVRAWDRAYERRYATSSTRLWRTLSTWVG